MEGSVDDGWSLHFTERLKCKTLDTVCGRFLCLLPLPICPQKPAQRAIFLRAGIVCLSNVFLLAMTMSNCCGDMSVITRPFGGACILPIAPFRPGEALTKGRWRCYNGGMYVSCKDFDGSIPYPDSCFFRGPISLETILNAAYDPCDESSCGTTPPADNGCCGCTEFSSFGTIGG